MLLVAFVTPVARGVDEEAYLKKVEDADVAIAAGKWADAERWLIEAMDMYPGNQANVMLMSNLGIVRFNMGLDSLAIATLDDAVSMAPRSVTVLENRARVLQGVGRVDDAFADYARALEVDSTAVTPLFYHGIMSLSRGDTVVASADLRRLERLAPETFEANLGMAMMLFQTGRSAEAIPYFNRVIDIDPQADYYGARALCRLQADQLAEAADDIAKGLEMKPDDGEFYLYRAILNKMRFRPDDARRDARRAIELGVPRQRVDSFME